MKFKIKSAKTISVLYFKRKTVEEKFKPSAKIIGVIHDAQTAVPKIALKIDDKDA